jgi:hypothetical protein
LQQNYHRVNAVFLFYSGSSHAYPGIAIEDFSFFAQECGLISSNLINETTLLKCFSETTVSTNNFKKSGENNTLYRYEFLEILVRIAAAILKQNEVVLTTQTTSTVL